MQDKKFSLIERFPSLMDYEDHVKQEFENVNPKPPVAGVIHKPQPLTVSIGGCAGKITLQASKKGKIGFVLKWGASRIDASMTDIEASELYYALEDFMMDFARYLGEVDGKRPLDYWHTDRLTVLEAARVQWQTEWAQYCLANGISFCAECGQMEVTEEGDICDWCIGQGELDAEEAKQVTRHEIFCPKCGEFLDQAYSPCTHCDWIGE